MVPLRWTAAMVQALTARMPCQTTLPGFVPRLHQALEPWQANAIDKVFAIPVLHVKATSLRVARKEPPDPRLLRQAPHGQVRPDR